uniref:Subtilisin-like protease n=2 Tax=Cajanus cajan TaxID=3821 RepID=A0A151SCC4_CAJCA|nr:Subtilisin-like protease [Cajanus cajan]
MPTSFNHHSVWYDSVLKSISNTTEMLYTYDNAIHGFSTRLTPEEARLLRSQTGILKVEPEKIYKPLTTRTPHFLGLDKIDNMLGKSNRGSDVIIGVIDTGVWPESKSFDDTGLGPIPSSWKGKCESGYNFSTSNCNKKLIGARCFSKGYMAMMGQGQLNEEDKPRYDSPRDYDGHGTHTASTAAGSPVEGASLFGFASGTARGMAPRARVAVYKVCPGDSCTTSDILAAMDAAISDNVNVLSLSLGSNPLPYDLDGIAVGAFAAMEKGIVVSCSAGNDGPASHSLNNNVAPWLLTVGAGTLDRDFPAYVSLGNGKNYSGVSLYSGDSLPDTPVPFVYAGNTSSFPLAQECLLGSLKRRRVKGKIVLCENGENSIVQKGISVKSVGGVGVVLAKAEKLELARSNFLPTIVLDSKAVKAIKEYLSSDPKSTATIVSQGTKVGIKPSPVVAWFSSRGPNTITPEILKPDLIAPGVNILAAWTKIRSPTGMTQDDRRVDFNILSGTSMSCPHVSGVAAFIKSVHPNWSPAAIRSALMTTAYSTYANGEKLIDSATDRPSTPFDIGAGHVDPVAALNPGLVYDLAPHDYLHFLCALNYTPDSIEAVARRKFKCDAHKHYSVTDLNYPSFVALFKPPIGKNNATVIKHTRTLTNVGAAGTYKASVMLDFPSLKIKVEPKVLRFKENEKKSYAVTFTALGPPSLTPPRFGRLEWSNGKIIVGSPISVFWDSTLVKSNKIE